MSDFSPLVRHRYCDPAMWQSPWLADLPEEYFERFGDHLAEVYLPSTIGPNSSLGGWWQREFTIQLFVRMQQSHHILLPWVKEVIDLRDSAVLEIGCGTGSSTAPFALAARSVVACDISADSLKACRLRCEILGATNVEFVQCDPDWLNRDMIDWPVALEQVDVVLCYALLEHLTIPERLSFLRALWAGIRTGTKVIFFETPNRLAPKDWHSSDLLFAQILPDELTVEYYLRSPREVVRRNQGSLAKELDRAHREKNYRWGRGVSFHEFELAIGLGNLRIINDGYSDKVLPHRSTWAAPDFEAALADLLSSAELGVHRGFARPSLDLIIEKFR